MTKKGLVRLLAVTTGASLMAASAQAASIPMTFAQVLESSANANPNIFAYLDNGTTAQLGTDIAGVFGAPAPAEFTFLATQQGSALPADLQGIQDCTITLTSSTSDKVATFGSIGDEPFNGNGGVNTLSITRDTPALEGTGGRTNLLTMTFTGSLMGALGGATPQLNGNSSLGDTVTYSSDFLTFAGSTQQDFSVTFTSWGPAVPPPPGLSVATDGFYNNATAAGTGTFDFQGAATVIPESSGLPLLALVLLPAAALLRRQRRNSTA